MFESFRSSTNSSKGARMRKTPILVFAHGTDSPEKGGGSGFRNLVEKGRIRDLPYVVVGVCTPYANGSVAAIAEKLRIPVHVLHKRPCAEQYAALMKMTGAAFAATSGYLWPVLGLPTEKVFNIHPGPLPTFGGYGMHGHHVHDAVIAAYKRGDVRRSAVSMHFVPPYEKTATGDNYDAGPVFASVEVEINPDDTAKTLGERVNRLEHRVQPAYTALVVEGLIQFRDGRVWMENPAWYEGHDLPYT